MSWTLEQPYFTLGILSMLIQLTMRRFLTLAMAAWMMGVLAGCEQANDSDGNFNRSESGLQATSQPEILTEASPPTVNLGPSAESSDEPPRPINLNVPFYSQAPRGDWGMPYQEACEEASLLLASYYARGEEPTPAEFENDLLAMVDWEVSYFGQFEHTSIDQTAEMARVYLGMTGGEGGGMGRVEVVEYPSADVLGAILAHGDAIVAPMAGRYLENPYFTGLGPVYHMLVIRGYKGDTFITNDVGTRHGKNYKYREEVLMEALHDWHPSAATDPEGILKGAKKVLVVKH